MKQKDIAVIALVVVLSAIASFIVSNMLFSSEGSRRQKAEKVDVITADFPLPDKKYFNEKSIDPTLPIQIGDSQNPNPFNSAAQ